MYLTIKVVSVSMLSVLSFLQQPNPHILSFVLLKPRSKEKEINKCLT